ncbi:hypothetical protein CIP107577_01963 [Corynebacterium diphtheriae]|nr:hypothetical protein CIP107577_01963 [Corynebacterium diphtheriae]
MMLINPRILNFSPADTNLVAHYSDKHRRTRDARRVVGYITMMIDQSSTGVPHMTVPTFDTTLFGDEAGRDTAIIVPAVLHDRGTVIPATSLPGYTYITENKKD